MIRNHEDMYPGNVTQCDGFASKCEFIVSPGVCRKLHKEELHELYSSPDIIKMVNSRKLRRSGIVARMGQVKNAYIVFELPD